jgi:hypothetical protein
MSADVFHTPLYAQSPPALVRARDIINNTATAGQKRDWLLLDTTDNWIGSNFQDGTYKNNRRLLFFPGATPARPWSVLAGADPDPFADEAARAAKVRSDRNAKAKARKAGGPTKGKSKTASRKKPAGRKVKAPGKTAKKTTAKKKKAATKTAAPKKKRAGKRARAATRRAASMRKKKSAARRR